MSNTSMNVCSAELLKKLFSAEQRIEYMLQFESALARSLAAAGLIPAEAASIIGGICSEGSFDAADLERRGTKAGTWVIPLVKELVARTLEKSEEASRFVHFGATSQDVLDTALVLQLKQAVLFISEELAQIESALDTLARKHANTAMLGRTLLQAGPPISFGLKVAGWKAAITRGRERLQAAADRSLLLQFGGSVGNLSALEDQGLLVARSLAKELELPLPDAPWHSQRDRLAELVSAVGILVGSLGKIARDISLHMQSEISELSESLEPEKGGSSAMPHKRNPVGCMQVLSAANRVPALVSSFLSGMLQEHERGLGGWQSEWTTVPDLFQAAGQATSAMADVTEGLKVNTGQMLRNLKSAKEIVFSERLSTALLPKLGRLEAQDLVAELVAQAIAQDKKLSVLAAEHSAIQSCLDSDALESIFDVESALGSSADFIDRLLKAREG